METDSSRFIKVEKTKNFCNQNECVANTELFVLNVTCTQIRKNTERVVKDR